MPEPTHPPRGAGLVRAHRRIAAALGLFLILHLGNHLALFVGAEAHGAVQSLLRPIYRAALVEPVLIALFAVQIGLGLALARRRGLGRGWALAQVASGAWLALFLVQHVPAVLAARLQSPPVETNAHFAAAVLHGSAGAYFAPYYALAVAALATHLAAALHFRARPARALPWAGLALGIALVAALARIGA